MCVHSMVVDVEGVGRGGSVNVPMERQRCGCTRMNGKVSPNGFLNTDLGNRNNTLTVTNPEDQ